MAAHSDDAADLYFVFTTYDAAAAKLSAIAHTVRGCTDTGMFIIVSMDEDYVARSGMPVLLHVYFPVIPVNFTKVVSICEASYPDDYDGASISKRTPPRSRSLLSTLKKVIKKH